MKLCAKVNNVSWHSSREFQEIAPGGEYIMNKRKFLQSEVKTVLKKARYGSPEYTRKYNPLPIEECRWPTKPDPLDPILVGIRNPNQWDKYCEDRIEERHKELQTLYAPNRSDWFYAERRYHFGQLYKEIGKHHRFLSVLYNSGLSYPWG